ncbi:conserved hypothetical protein [Chelatococcus asaccharovorans]|nr:conserved hypothetical protein [Chelatococcus asaccharovorans]CAH1687602.1 conserved hypothetical protein [Chelatococcus asaccharovorans]
MPGQTIVQPSLPFMPIAVLPARRRAGIIASMVVAAGLSLTAGALPAAAQYFYDRPPGYVPLPPEPVPEAPWVTEAPRARRPWAPPPRSYADDAMPRGAVESLLARRGYSVEGPLRRRGDVYVATVMDRRGTLLRLAVDAFDGTILSRRVVAEVVPDWRDAPSPGSRWGAPDWDDESDAAPGRRYGSRGVDERYAAREPARPVEPRVIPAPPMPRSIAPKAGETRAQPNIPHPPARPQSLGSDEGSGTPSPPEVAQAQPGDPARSPPLKSVQPERPAVVDIAPPDLPEVPPPSF